MRRLISGVILAGTILAAASGEEAGELKFSTRAGAEFLFDKRDLRRLDFFEASGPGADAVEWQVDGVSFGQGAKASLLRREGQGKVEAVVGEKRVAIGTAEFKRSVRPGNFRAGIRFFAPDVIYDDEVREFYREFYSRLPVPGEFTILQQPDRDNRLFPATSDRVEHQVDAADRFAPERYLKQRVELAGAELTEPLGVTWSVRLGGVEVLRERVRFIPADQLPELRIVDGVFSDSEGARVIPVIHRRRVDERRRFELGRMVSDRLPGERVHLVMADDFGLFATEFQRLRKGRGEQTKWYSWRPAGVDIAGFDWMEALPRALDELRTTNAAVVTIIPPPVRCRPGTRNAEEWARLADLLIAAAAENPAIRQVSIATSFPDPLLPESAGYERMLRRNRRDNGVGFIELRAEILAMSDWIRWYRMSPVELAVLPIPGALEAARLLDRLLQ